MKKVLIAVGVVIVVGVFVVVNLRREGSKIDVRVAKVERRDIVKFITATGRIQPTRKVDVSASAIGKVTRLAVEEGDTVKKGDFLLEIDPIEYQSAVDQMNASIRAAKASVEMEQAALAKAEYDLERAKTLHERNLLSDEELRTAQLNVDVARAKVRNTRETLAQYQATLRKAEHDLGKVRVTAEISGVVTVLNVEEGENAIMGTLNVPGTVLLTVADLSEIEAEVEVDETEVVFVRVGQEAVITLDAYPDSSFKGHVTEVGNSPIQTQMALGQSSVDFKVVVAIDDRVPNVRPGLSASAKIRVAEVPNALSIPIQALTVRARSELEGDGESAEGGADTDVEGVFVVVDGATARYREVRVGIAGSEYFQVVAGLEEDESVVTGPFQAINRLADGDPVKIETKAGKDD